MPPAHPAARRFAVAAALAILGGCTPTPAPVPPALSSTGSPSPTSTGLTRTATQTPSATPDWRSGPRVEGLDVSAYQPDVPWTSLRQKGLRFVWIKATEGTSWRSAHFDRQRRGALAEGFLVGAYHYARPAHSSAAAQAAHLLSVAGEWTADGRTLPGAVDLERAEQGDPCHGLSPDELRSWVVEFAQAYRTASGRSPVLYVRDDLWRECVGDPGAAAALPLWLYDHDREVGPWPPGWLRPTIWQRGVVGGLDRNVWFGSEQALREWAERE